MNTRERMTDLALAIENEVSGIFLGQEEVLRHVVISLIAGGHVLLEGIPGLGKTLLVKALAQTIGGESSRVQFTPDLMPSDITGHVMYDARNAEFYTRQGPIFTNILIADEINRAPAKTQSALFEAMQEYQVSIDGKSHALPRPFMTLATQNPFEHEGTYPLPDAQKDRFLMKLLITYPAKDQERDMVISVTEGAVGEGLDVSRIRKVCSIDDLQILQKEAAGVICDPAVADYAVRIVRETRSRSSVDVGAGPRAGIALIRTARAAALIDDRDFVLPEDIKKLALPVLRHRIRLTPESEIEGVGVENTIAAVMKEVEAPKS